LPAVFRAAEKSGRDVPAITSAGQTDIDCLKTEWSSSGNCGAECTIADGQRQLKNSGKAASERLDGKMFGAMG
jgi:hypothetical protein